MRKVALLLSSLCSATLAHSQHCGFEHFETLIKREPTAKAVYDSVNADMAQWMVNDERSRLYGQELRNPYSFKDPDKAQQRSLCGYDNSYFGWGNAPTVVGNTLVANDMYGGDYVTIFGMQANRSYRISTCGLNDFDTQITVYPQGGGNAVAHNDDACANNQSEIIFSPLADGNYDILLDEYDCGSTFLYGTTVTIELLYENRPIYVLPVVFHVVYNTPEENLPDQEIYNQLVVLNQNFNRANSGLGNVPAPFRGQSSNPLIQFCLAQQDPNGNATSGITRHSTQVNSFPSFNETYCSSQSGPCLFNSNQGGADEWDKTRFINIWVADLEDYLGYAYPKHQVVSQNYGANYTGRGIAMNYRAFGTNHSGLLSLHNQGKTLVHEMGHYFNLWHTWHWSDEENLTCLTLADSVIDTPAQDSASKPNYLYTFPAIDACSQIFPGFMYQNHMDYSRDAYREMFTYYQTSRTDYALFNWYQSLITSPGCTPGVVTSVPEPQLAMPIDRYRIIDLSGRAVYESSSLLPDLNSLLTPGIYILQGLSQGRLVSAQKKLIR